MLWSELLIPTLREAPADAEIASHRLLLRAGLVRKLAGGAYSFLPLGLRSLRKLETIIREEMNRAGAQEVLLPALHPRELWKKGPRYEAALPVMFAARSRTDTTADTEFLLGPTHEEVITELVAGHINSYRQLPKTFYQIQTKFRDEIRPRFGLMRAREFSMKDAYSFDATDDAAKLSYEKMYNAYKRIFARAGLRCVVVEADTGVMGGSFSHEFQVPCTIGESEVVFSDDGQYMAAIEKARTQPVPRTNPSSPSPAPEKFATPTAKTIEELTSQHSVPACDQIKTLAYLCDSRFVLLLLRGDHQLCEAKVGALGYQEYRPATEEEIVAALGAHPGSLGACGVDRKKIFKIHADLDLQEQLGMTTGANEDGFHLRQVDMGRDIRPDSYASLRTAQAGELTETGSPVRIERAIEVGHVFKLGTKYSDAFGAKYLDESGKSQTVVMGCYGIGVGRTLQAVVEQSHDDNGILWPVAIAPFTAAILQLDKSLSSEALKLRDELTALGVDAIVDDRDERPGVKFKDADLIGFPIRVTLGEKSLKAGGVELKWRHQKESTLVPLDQAAATVRQWAAAASDQ